jgi:hypothetical protein
MFASIEAKLLLFVAVIVTVGSIILGVYYYGKHAQRVKDEIQAKEQQIQTLNKEKEQDANTYQVATTYSAEIDRLHANLNWMRNHPKAPVSRPSNSPIIVNGTVPEQLGACEGTEFYTNALTDVIKLNALQRWIRLQGFPVK